MQITCPWTAGSPHCRASESRTAPVAGKRADTILNLMLFIELFTLNRAWDGLTDEELHWEPHPGAWGVRRRDECSTPTPLGPGESVMDFDADLATAAVGGGAVEPMTSIAWLFSHIGSTPGMLADRDFLGGSLGAGEVGRTLYQPAVFTTADHAVSTMREGWRALDRALQPATDEQLERPSLEYYGPSNGMQFTVQALNEISHHGTQICMLRDLYRAQRTSG
jgi:hypothetical protein